MRAVRGQDGRPALVEFDAVPGEGELLSMRSVGICSSDLLYLQVGTATGGTISVLGVHYSPVEVPSLPMLNKEATLITSMGYCSHDGGRDMAQAAEMLAARPELADALITRRFPIEDAPEAFRVAADRASGSITVVVEVD